MAQDDQQADGQYQHSGRNTRRRGLILPRDRKKDEWIALGVVAGALLAVGYISKWLGLDWDTLVLVSFMWLAGIGTYLAIRNDKKK